MKNRKTSFDFLDIVLLLIALSGLLVQGIAVRRPDLLPHHLTSPTALYLVVGVAIFSLLLFVGKFIHMRSRERSREARGALTLSTVAAVLFTGAVLLGVYLAGPEIYPFFMYRPWMNGTIAAAFLLGFVEAITSAYWGTGWSTVFVFALAVAIFAVRPKGLFGYKYKTTY